MSTSTYTAEWQKPDNNTGHLHTKNRHDAMLYKYGHEMNNSRDARRNMQYSCFHKDEIWSMLISYSGTKQPWPVHLCWPFASPTTRVTVSKNKNKPTSLLQQPVVGQWQTSFDSSNQKITREILNKFLERMLEKSTISTNVTSSKPFFLTEFNRDRNISSITLFTNIHKAFEYRPLQLEICSKTEQISGRLSELF